MKPPPSQLEPFAVRRASIADRDKVRYRVYSSPTEFIAVIAENALVAVKLSGISKPHRIVRDLPTEGIAIEAKKMAQIDESASEKVAFSTTPSVKEGLMVKDLPAQGGEAKEVPFKPMSLMDMQSTSTIKARILPPELLMEIIQTHVRAQLEQTVSSMATAPVQVAPPEPQPPEPEEPSPHDTTAQALEAAAVETREISQEERVLALADEVLPPVSIKQEEIGKRELSPNEVDKLLNE